MALLGNRDGSDPSSHLRNMTRLFPFFRISSEMGAHTLRHTLAYRKYKKKKKKKKKHTQQLHVAGYYNAEISLHIDIPFSIQHLYCLKYKTHHFLNKTKSFFIPKPVVLFVNERNIWFLPCDCHSLFESQSVGCLA